MTYLDDNNINYTDRSIIHDGGASTVYSSRHAYSQLMDLFDELEQMDETVPMSAQTPTEFTLINSWFMDYPSFQYLSGGAIKTDGWKCDAGGVTESGIRIIDFAAAAYTNFIKESDQYF